MWCRMQWSHRTAPTLPAAPLLSSNFDKWLQRPAGSGQQVQQPRPHNAAYFVHSSSKGKGGGQWWWTCRPQAPRARLRMCGRVSAEVPGAACCGALMASRRSPATMFLNGCRPLWETGRICFAMGIRAGEGGVSARCRAPADRGGTWQDDGQADRDCGHATGQAAGLPDVVGKRRRCAHSYDGSVML